MMIFPNRQNRIERADTISCRCYFNYVFPKTIVSQWCNAPSPPPPDDPNKSKKTPMWYICCSPQPNAWFDYRRNQITVFAARLLSDFVSTIWQHPCVRAATEKIRECKYTTYIYLQGKLVFVVLCLAGHSFVAWIKFDQNLYVTYSLCKLLS